MTATAMRVLPRSIGLKLCDMGASGAEITWSRLYGCCRFAEPYIREKEPVRLESFQVGKEKRHEVNSTKRRRFRKVCRNESHWTDQCKRVDG